MQTEIIPDGSVSFYIDLLSGITQATQQLDRERARSFKLWQRLEGKLVEHILVA
jgi:hypothetical protein